DSRLPELVGLADEPVVEQVVVVRAGWMSGLSGHVLPAAELRAAEVREQPVGRRPAAGVVAGVWDVPHLAHGLLRAAGGQTAGEQAVEQLRRTGVGLAQRVGERDAVDAAPGPASRVGAVALLELVERARQRLQRQIVP